MPIVADENFNITVRAENNVTQVKTSISCSNEAPGHLRIGRVQIPDCLCGKLAAERATRSAILHQKPATRAELVIEALNFDASQRAQDKGHGQRASFGGTLHFALGGASFYQGKNLAKSYDTKLRSTPRMSRSEDAAVYFRAPKPPVAKLAKLSVNSPGNGEAADVGRKCLRPGRSVDLRQDQSRRRGTGGKVHARAGGTGHQCCRRKTPSRSMPRPGAESVNDFP
jgi:hypothetical protein